MIGSTRGDTESGGAERRDRVEAPARSPIPNDGTAIPGGAADSAPREVDAVLAPREVDAVLASRILALTPERISSSEVRQVLAHAPAPTILAFQGSLPMLTMRPLADFLIAMGYPEASLRDPATGELSYSSRDDSARLAGLIAGLYERDGLMPMLIGHSQGGMLVLRILHELAGSFHSQIAVRDPDTGRELDRKDIFDPLTGLRQPVVGLRVGYAAVIATGTLPRILLGQWDMIPRLREVPDSVEEFTGFTIAWDPIAGNLAHGEAYKPMGRAVVGNVLLASAVSHIGAVQLAPLASDEVAREWIEAYVPGAADRPGLPVARVDTRNIVQAAELWYHIKKHWCVEAQRWVRARQRTAAPDVRR